MDENNLNNQDGQGPNYVPNGGDGGKTLLKRKVAIGATVALVVAGLGLGGAGRPAPSPPSPRSPRSRSIATAARSRSPRRPTKPSTGPSRSTPRA